MRSKSDDFPGVRRRPNKLAGCCGTAALLLLLSVLTVGYLYHARNHPSLIDIPTPALPPDNAYDDFILVGKQLHNIKHQTVSNLPVPPAGEPAFCHL